MKKLIIGLALGFLVAASWAGAAGYRSYFATDKLVTSSIVNLTNIELVSASDTLTAADSGTTFMFQAASGAVVMTLPAPTDGMLFTFVVDLAFDTADITVVTAGGTDLIDGNLTVNSVGVACANEDVVTFELGAEIAGDYVDLYSDGTNWYIGKSWGTSAASISCSAS